MTFIIAIFAFVYFIYFVANAPVLVASLVGDFEGPAWGNYLSRFKSPGDNVGARLFAAMTVLVFGLVLIAVYVGWAKDCRAAWLVLPEGVLLACQGIFYGASFKIYQSVQSFAQRSPVLFLWTLTVPKILVLVGLFTVYRA